MTTPNLRAAALVLVLVSLTACATEPEPKLVIWPELPRATAAPATTSAVAPTSTRAVAPTSTRTAARKRPPAAIAPSSTRVVTHPPPPGKGTELFRSGAYFKAAERYRLDLLARPRDVGSKLAFGTALFAIGNYSYASYALRRAVNDLDDEAPFFPAVEAYFPDRARFVAAVRDLKLFVTHSPKDRGGLTVLAYVLFTVADEQARGRMILRCLRQLDPEDPFAAFLLRRLGPRPARAKRPSPRAR